MDPNVLAPLRAEVPDAVGRPLATWRVVVLLAGYLCATTLVWLVGAIVASARLGPNAPKDAVTASLLYLAPILLPASEAAGGLALVLALRGWAKRLDPTTFLAIAPSRWGTRRQILVGGAAGAAVGAVFLLLSGRVAYHPTHPPSVLVQAASTPGATRWAWVVSALLLAPPIEEGLFRGALLGGLSQVWGPPAGMLISGLAFWLLHAFEWLEYWPAAVALGLLTVLVTGLRVRTRTLGPCIAAHVAYNCSLAVAAFGFPSHGAG